MKRGTLIFWMGLLLAAIACCTFSLVKMASYRTMLAGNAPELAWLKQEFHLDEAQFNRIARLHAAYLPKCAEMCRRIDAIHAELKEQLQQTETVTPEIERKLAEAGAVRVECQTMMLKHFVEVSRTMTPEQGQRYLKWVQSRTLSPAHGMSDGLASPTAH